jgi:hypothetical protein
VTSAIHDVLDDLATTAAPHVVPPDLAAISWRAGRRRRVRRRLRAGLVAAAALAAVAGSVAQLAPAWQDAAAPAGQVVTGYPTRIEHQRTVTTVPDRPGPMAGLLEVRAEIGTDWHVFSSTGRRWRVPMAFNGSDDRPTISRDGRHLGYLADRQGPYVIHDLVTGERVEFPDIASEMVTETSKYHVWGQHPTYWSPDSRWLVRTGALRKQVSTGRTLAFLLGVDGSLREVTPEFGGIPAGWVDAEHLAWYRGNYEEPRSPTVSVTRLDGALVANDSLHAGSPWAGKVFSQWAVTLSPDGTRLAVTEDGFPSDALRRFDLNGRREVGSRITVDGRIDVCTMSWAGNDPVVVAHWPDYRSSLQAIKLDGKVLTPLVRVEPESNCVMLAEAALNGKAHGPIRASWSWPVLWWWQEILAGSAILAAAATWLLLVGRRRLRRRRHASISFPA